MTRTELMHVLTGGANGLGACVDPTGTRLLLNELIGHVANLTTRLEKAEQEIERLRGDGAGRRRIGGPR